MKELIDEFEEQRECTYKGEHYLVRDNGAVLRLPKDGKRARPMDGQWLFGKKDESSRYMLISGHRVHIIVATAFYGERDSKEFVVDHIDTNRCNNRKENLRWLTRLENILVNDITRAKIERICGSVENFLANPQMLRGHESENPNFKWMRTVTKEEAANVRAHWEQLIAHPREKSGNGQIDEWIFGPVASRKPSPDIEQKKQIDAEKEKALKQLQRKQQVEALKRQKEEQRASILTAINALCEKNGWTVKMKAKGTGWKADVLISSETKRLAVQLFRDARKIEEDIEKMHAEGVDSLFLGEHYYSSSDELIPSFKLEFGDSQIVAILFVNDDGNNRDNEVPLDTLIEARMAGKLITKDSIMADAIKVRFVEEKCYKCGAKHTIYLLLGIYEGRTYFCGVEDEFDPSIISSVVQYVDDLPELGYVLGEIKERTSGGWSEPYMSFGCPQCDAIVGQHYLFEYGMDFCSEPNDADVHVIELSEPLRIECSHWVIGE